MWDTVLVGRRDVVRSYQEGIDADVVDRAIENLHRQELFPFSYDNPKFDTVNMLAALAFFEGVREPRPIRDAPKERKRSPTFRIEVYDKVDRDNLGALLSEFDGKINHMDDYVRLPAYMTRLLGCLGVPTTKETMGTVSVPGYIGRLYNPGTYSDDGLDGFTERRRDIVRGFFSYLLYANIAETTKTQDRIIIGRQEVGEELAQRRADDIHPILCDAFPELELVACKPYSPNGDGFYVPAFLIEDGFTDRLEAEFSERVKTVCDR